MRFAAVTAVALGVAAPLPVRAQAAPSASLWASWQAPLECPQEASFVAQTEAFLGSGLNARGDRKLEIVGRVRSDQARGFVVKLHIVTSRATQERELAHRDCAELSEAAALIVALAIDPQLIVPDKKQEQDAASSPEAPPPNSPPAGAVAARVEPAPLAPTLAPIQPVPPAEVRARDRVPAAEPPPLHASVSALGLFGSSVLPGAGVGTAVHAAVGPERFRLAAQGAYWLSRFRAIRSGSDAGVELGTWSVALKGCGLPLAGRLALALCAGPVVGDMYGSGTGGLSNARTLHDHWSALATEVSLSLASSAGVTTLVGLELQKTLEAPRFGVTLDGRETQVFEANAWVVNGFVGLGVFR